MQFCSHLFSLAFHIVSLELFSAADICLYFTTQIAGLSGPLRPNEVLQDLLLPHASDIQLGHSIFFQH